MRACVCVCARACVRACVPRAPHSLAGAIQVRVLEEMPSFSAKNYFAQNLVQTGDADATKPRPIWQVQLALLARVFITTIITTMTTARATMS